MRRQVPTASASCGSASISTEIGRLVILVEDVLDGVEIMLAHVAEAAAIIVPVAAEGADGCGGGCRVC